ncbi:hypothetical protein BX34_15550 [Escherichia coli O157:H7 str. 2009EL1705]|uniref:hypothetical protein n=1 Tax=Escherichia coli TaxID=562 RepID=UPI00044DBC4F|nr:hypothetical protein [Escherichia coli]EYV70617.1 hypothetical protein BX34_15550 [Escherichia coli O157:H7 str. 2009EL1705]
MRSFSQLWPTLKRLLAYGSPWRKPLGIAVLMMWVAAAAEVSGPLLISYFIDNMVAKNNLPLKVVAGLAAAYVGLQLFAAGLHYAQSMQRLATQYGSRFTPCERLVEMGARGESFWKTTATDLQ